MQPIKTRAPSEAKRLSDDAGYPPASALATRHFLPNLSSVSDLETPTGCDAEPPSPSNLFDVTHTLSLSSPSHLSTHAAAAAAAQRRAAGGAAGDEGSPPAGRPRRPSAFRAMRLVASLDGDEEDAEDDDEEGDAPGTSGRGAAPRRARGGSGAGSGGPSRYRGVVWHKSNGKWEARIYEAGRQRFLGYYTCDRAAAAAYDAQAVKLHGSAAKLNFPGSRSGQGPAAGAAAPAGVRKPATKRGARGTRRAPPPPSGRAQPVKGSSRFRGVSWNSNCAKWRAQVWKGSDVHHLGYFEDETAAARAYDAAALRIRGPEAPTNFPRWQYGVGASEDDEGASSDSGDWAAVAAAARQPSARAAARAAAPPPVPADADARAAGSCMHGVSWCDRRGAWVAELWDGASFQLLGTFATEAEAARSYDVACLDLHGADALTNFPVGGYEVELAALTLRVLSSDHAGLAAGERASSSGGQGWSAGAEWGGGEACSREGASTDSAPPPVAAAGRGTTHVTRGASGYMGVCWDKRKQRWFSQIQQAGRRRFLGYFATDREAAAAYDRAALRLNGPAAQTNFEGSPTAAAAAAAGEGPASSHGDSAIDPAAAAAAEPISVAAPARQQPDAGAAHPAPPPGTGDLGALRGTLAAARAALAAGAGPLSLRGAAAAAAGLPPVHVAAQGGGYAALGALPQQSAWLAVPAAAPPPALFQLRPLAAAAQPAAVAAPPPSPLAALPPGARELLKRNLGGDAPQAAAAAELDLGVWGHAKRPRAETAAALAPARAWALPPSSHHQARPSTPPPSPGVKPLAAPSPRLPYI